MKALLVVIAIDGVARQDAYNQELMPHMFALRQAGRDYPNIFTGNPHGVSLPAYADFFSRKRTDVSSNVSAFKASTTLRVHSAWSPLCEMTGVKPHDSDTESVSGAIDDVVAGRSVFLHLGGADKEAHAADSLIAGHGADVGRGGYEGELRKADAYVRAVWNSAMRHGRARMLVFTDHGRSATNWRKHGDDAYSARSWALVVGQGVVSGIDDRPLRIWELPGEAD